MKNVVMVTIKKIDNKGNPMFKGVFKKVVEEIKNGNILSGITFDAGQVGFVFGNEPDISPQETVEALETKEPLSEVQFISNDGKEYKDEKSKFKKVIREIPLMDVLDKKLDEVSTLMVNMEPQKAKRELMYTALHWGGAKLIDKIKEYQASGKPIPLNLFDEVMRDLQGHGSPVGIDTDGDPGVQLNVVIPEKAHFVANKIAENCGVELAEVIETATMKGISDMGDRFLINKGQNTKDFVDNILKQSVEMGGAQVVLDAEKTTTPEEAVANGGELVDENDPDCPPEVKELIIEAKKRGMDPKLVKFKKGSGGKGKLKKWLGL